MALLQQFLNFLGGLRMGRPESVSSAPVPHLQASRQRIRIQQVLRIIRSPAGGDPFHFDERTSFGNGDFAGYWQIVLVVLWRSGLPQVGSHKDKFGWLAEHLPAQRKREFFPRCSLCGGETQ